MLLRGGRDQLVITVSPVIPRAEPPNSDCHSQYEKNEYFLAHRIRGMKHDGEEDTLLFMLPFIILVVAAELRPEIARLIFVIYAFVACGNVGLHQDVSLQPDVRSNRRPDLQLSSERAAIDQHFKA